MHQGTTPFRTIPQFRRYRRARELYEAHERAERRAERPQTPSILRGGSTVGGGMLHERTGVTPRRLFDDVTAPEASAPPADPYSTFRAEQRRINMQTPEQRERTEILRKANPQERQAFLQKEKQDRYAKSRSLKSDLTDAEREKYTGLPGLTPKPPAAEAITPAPIPAYEPALAQYKKDAAQKPQYFRRDVVSPAATPPAPAPIPATSPATPTAQTPAVTKPQDDLTTPRDKNGNTVQSRITGPDGRIFLTLSNGENHAFSSSAQADEFLRTGVPFSLPEGTAAAERIKNARPKLTRELFV